MKKITGLLVGLIVFMTTYAFGQRFLAAHYSRSEIESIVNPDTTLTKLFNKHIPPVFDEGAMTVSCTKLKYHLLDSAFMDSCRNSVLIQTKAGEFKPQTILAAIYNVLEYKPDLLSDTTANVFFLGDTKHTDFFCFVLFKENSQWQLIGNLASKIIDVAVGTKLFFISP
jgi:hypothetical protein